MSASWRREPIEVVARFDQEGAMTPLSFNWRSSEVRVASTGRSWIDETGAHFLVLVPVDQVYELVFVREEMLWYLKVPAQARA